MKNKKVVYILLPATLAVWIVIAVKIYNTLNPASESNSFSPDKIKKESTQQTVSDTFAIDNTYRDPFGRSQHVSTVNAGKSGTTAVKKEVRPVPIPKNDSWPLIVYSGMIKNQKSNKQLVLVSIKGNVRTLKTGDVSDEVTIGKIFKDSIEVIYGKQRRFVRK